MTTATAAPPTLLRPLVLVVDDDPAILAALIALLGPRVEPLYRVETAASAEEALDLVSTGASGPGEQSPVALVISDEKMPGRSGTDLLVELRRHPAHRDGGRIIVTAYAGLESAKHAINDAEVDRYYPKPWDSESALIPAAGEILSRFASRRGLDRYLVAAPVDAGDWEVATADALAAVRGVRREWWGYLNLLGEPAGEDDEVPSFHEPEDRGAVHLLARRRSPREDVPAGAIRLRRAAEGGGWILDGLAFLPEEAGDDLETLLLRTALLEAARRGIGTVRTSAPLLRREVYDAVGFAPATPAAPEAPPGTLWMDAAPATAIAGWTGVGFAPRFTRERRLCACIQAACPMRDYAAERRGYFCPLDVAEQRVPVGFPCRSSAPPSS